VITTKEKAVRRNPPKEFNVAINVSDWERPKSKKTVQPDGASPGPKKREHDAVNGQSSYTTYVASR
jgi:gamma-tubulin complex component 2